MFKFNVRDMYTFMPKYDEQIEIHVMCPHPHPNPSGQEGMSNEVITACQLITAMCHSQSFNQIHL